MQKNAGNTTCMDQKLLVVQEQVEDEGECYH